MLVGMGGEGWVLSVMGGDIGLVGGWGEGSGGRWALIGVAGEAIPPVGSEGEGEGERGRESVGPWPLSPRRLGLPVTGEVTSGEGVWSPLGLAGERVDSRVTMGTDDELHFEGACSDVPNPTPVSPCTSLVSMASNIGLRSNETPAVSMRTTSSSTSSVSMATISMATVSIAAASIVTGIPTATPLPLSTGTVKRVCHWKRFLPLSPNVVLVETEVVGLMVVLSEVRGGELLALASPAALSPFRQPLPLPLWLL